MIPHHSSSFSLLNVNMWIINMSEKHFSGLISKNSHFYKKCFFLPENDPEKTQKNLSTTRYNDNLKMFAFLQEDRTVTKTCRSMRKGNFMLNTVKFLLKMFFFYQIFICTTWEILIFLNLHFYLHYKIHKYDS